MRNRRIPTNTAKTMARRHYEAQVKAWGEEHVLPWPEFRERWCELHGGHFQARQPSAESKAWNGGQCPKGLDIS